MSDATKGQNIRRALSVRARFDVFKRDGFACQYCGATPPGAALECDHIIPIAQGGGNDPENLITACASCNRGKGAIALNVVPQSLAEKAAEIEEREAQIRGFTEVMEARRARIEAGAWRVFAVLSPGADAVPRAEFESVKRFIERAGVMMVLDAAEIAMGSPAGSGFSRSRLFKYFCGVCWKKIRDAEGVE